MGELKECDVCLELVDENELEVRKAKPDEIGFSNGFEQDFGHGKVVVCPKCFNR